MHSMDVSTSGNSHEEKEGGELQADHRLSSDNEDCSLNNACEREVEFNVDEEDKSTEENEAHGQIIPTIGMEFETDQHAYDFYNDYASRVGFSVRKEWINKNRLGVITRRRICCSREGTRRERRQDTMVKIHRKITRVGCKAHMLIAIQANKKYRLIEFEDTHNHLCAPQKTYLSRSEGKVIAAQASKTNIADGVGVIQKEASDFMGAQVRGQENVNFLLIDYKNRLHCKRTRSMEKGDAEGVLKYLQKMLIDAPGFVYAIQPDAEDQITNIFWADSRMVLDYHEFGDVVCFDTTYKTNNYDRPFAHFMGVTHHKKTVIFGAALLYDETIESFQWVFKAFLNAMSNKHPQTILTDQDKVMSNAIALVMPDTSHRICVQHIYQNVTKHLSHVFNSSRSFDGDFSKCIYDFDDEDDFLDAWDNMLDKYNLRENTCLQQLFHDREKWALVYRRDTFCVDIKTTQRNESINSNLKRYLNRSHDLLQFFSHFEGIVFNRRNAEDEADFEMTKSTPILILPLPMLVAARNLYTPEIFQLFQEEYGKGMSYTPRIVDQIESIVTYKVLWVEKNREYIVTFDSTNQTVACSCKKFEFTGFLCGHALRVIDHMGLREVPDKYILKRWRKDAKSGFINSSRRFISSDDKRNMTQRYKELMHRSIKLNNLAAENEGAFSIALKFSDLAFAKVEEFLSQTPQLEPGTNVSKKKGIEGCEGANGTNADIDVHVQRSPEINTVVNPTQVNGVKRKKRGNACDSMRHPIPVTQPGRVMQVIDMQIDTVPSPCAPMRHPTLVTRPNHTMQTGTLLNANPLSHSILPKQPEHIRQGIYRLYQQSRGHLMNQYMYPLAQESVHSASRLSQESSISGTEQSLFSSSISREERSERGQQLHM